MARTHRTKESIIVKLSTKGRYGVILMLDLAMHIGIGPISLKSIAERHQLSEHYLEQLISPLRNAGFVKSVRGAYGGYTLAFPPANITVGQVIEVLEGPIAIADENDSLSHLWDRVSQVIKNELDAVTIETLVEEQQSAGDGYMYYI